MHIHLPDVVTAFGRLLASPSHASTAQTITVWRSLARVQIKRAAAGFDVGYFADDLDAAERWLTSISPPSHP